eukprot:10976506-Prorocentrum_lima.AAC.1
MLPRNLLMLFSIGISFSCFWAFVPSRSNFSLALTATAGSPMLTPSLWWGSMAPRWSGPPHLT